MVEKSQNDSIDAITIYQWLELVIERNKTSKRVENDDTQPQDQGNVAASRRWWIAAGAEVAVQYREQESER